MNNFSEHFNLQNLDETELGMISFVLNSPAYTNVFSPYLKTIRNSMNKQMLDRSGERKDKYPDDFLAGGIVAIDGLLSFFTLLIEETNMEQIHKAMSSSLNDAAHYQELAKSGNIIPVLGANQSDTSPNYKIEEDY